MPKRRRFMIGLTAGELNALSLLYGEIEAGGFQGWSIHEERCARNLAGKVASAKSSLIDVQDRATNSHGAARMCGGPHGPHGDLPPAEVRPVSVHCWDVLDQDGADDEG